MIGILSPWPRSVAEGSGTTVSQNGLVDALELAGLPAELVYSSHFATTSAGLEERRVTNEDLEGHLAGYDAVLGIDGEGWLWAARPRRIPYVAFCEAVLVEVVPFEASASAELLAAQAQWEGAAARSADAVVARSQFAADRVAEAYGVPRELITVLPIPFDVDRWKASLPAAPRELLVLAVGHAYPRKNYRALLAAWPAVVEARPPARLILVGTGPEMTALHRLAEGVPSVSLRGHVPYAELRELYARASVFCHPSLQENFGIAVVEGLASGASVVTHRDRAVLENTTGVPGAWAVDAHQPEALAHALIEALDARVPWPDERLRPLRDKLSPRAVGAKLAAVVAAAGKPYAHSREV